MMVVQHDSNDHGSGIILTITAWPAAGPGGLATKATAVDQSALFGQRIWLVDVGLVIKYL